MTFAGLMLKEVLVGLAYAFALGAVFAAVSVAGSLMDVTVGFSFGSLVDPITGNHSQLLSQLYAMVGVLILRIFDEEKFLSSELPGYAEYKEKVRYRLIPHLW